MVFSHPSLTVQMNASQAHLLSEMILGKLRQKDSSEGRSPTTPFVAGDKIYSSSGYGVTLIESTTAAGNATHNGVERSVAQQVETNEGAIWIDLV